MTGRPILFSAPMVRALLAGTKTQTRRIMKPQPTEALDVGRSIAAFIDRRPHFDKVAGRVVGAKDVSVRCPYGVPGDRLWVRESFKTSDSTCVEDGAAYSEGEHECSAHCRQTYVYYAATPRQGLRPKPDGARITYLDDSTPLTEWYQRGWKPSIHMPRWASRLLLEVTEVRAQRLQDISEEDARAEGVKPFPNDPEGDMWTDGKYRTAFEYLWGEINGWDSWQANPWVWAVSFRRLSPQPQTETIPVANGKDLITPQDSK